MLLDCEFFMKLWKALKLDKMTKTQKQQLSNFLDNEFEKLEKKVKKTLDNK